MCKVHVAAMIAEFLQQTARSAALPAGCAALVPVTANAIEETSHVKPVGVACHAQPVFDWLVG